LSNYCYASYNLYNCDWKYIITCTTLLCIGLFALFVLETWQLHVCQRYWQ
jgi:hypothetical protein